MSSTELPEQVSTQDIETETVQRVAIAAAIGRLDERAQDLLAMRYGADLTARQIGEVLGLRTNAVEVALHRALARLRLELEEASHPARPPLADPAPRISP